MDGGTARGRGELLLVGWFFICVFWKMKMGLPPRMFLVGGKYRSRNRVVLRFLAAFRKKRCGHEAPWLSLKTTVAMFSQDSHQ